MTVPIRPSKKLRKAFTTGSALAWNDAITPALSVARNLAIACSRAPLLLLYDDDLNRCPA